MDPEVAIELARGVRRRLSSSWGVGVTGVAGPEPQDGQAVGTVFVGIAGPADAGETVCELNLRGDRNMIRDQTVEHVVTLLLTASAQRSAGRADRFQ